MKKWLKRLLLTICLLLVVLTVLSASSVYMLRREPDWYARPAMSPEVQEAAAARAAHQISRVSDMAESLRAYEARRQKALREGTTLPANDTPEPITVRLSEDEINAFYKSNSKLKGWSNAIEDVVQDPTIVLQKDRLILAGKLREANLIASAYFAPAIDETGQLRLDFVRMMGGKLPLPDMVFGKYRDKATGVVTGNLPYWQNNAKLDSRGFPNDPTVRAAMGKLLLQSVDHAPAEPVVFLPLLGARETVPVRITRLIVTDGQIELTLAPMTEQDRQAMLRRVCEPYPPKVAVQPSSFTP